MGGCGWTRSGSGQDVAVHAGRMPDLSGWDLNELGDGDNGVLYDLHELLGVQTTRYIADDTVGAGIVLDQEPPPGVALDTVESWTLTVSAGGPVTSFDDLPPDLRALAASLDGYDRSEPVLVLETDEGVAYKTDEWVLSRNCEDDPAYRRTPDTEYRWACPEIGNAAEQGEAPTG